MPRHLTNVNLNYIVLLNFIKTLICTKSVLIIHSILSDFYISFVIIVNNCSLSPLNRSCSFF